ncbi:hypothetical protein [Candidatus Poriferisodalis sp.]|uniref:hypothetical protein n=1 Tax=Candidatus Poriferisodalis sp. TaxID=3101277 RepID=UPI003B0170B4
MRATAPMRRIRKSALQVDEAERRSEAELRGAAADVIMLGRFYYLFLAFNIGTSGLQFAHAYMGQPPTAPLWPIDAVGWLTGSGWFEHDRVVTVVGLLFAIGAAGFPRLLVWRLGSFAYLLVHVALANSYGAINHGSHIMLFVGFALLFLPGRDEGRLMARKSVLRCLAVLWFAQGLILLSYTLSGFWKLWHSRLEVFSTDAMSRILLDRALLEADNIPILLPFVAQHNWLAQSMWWLTLYIEVFALLVVFRPHLHRPFGAVLMLFHITSDWLMNISFSLNIVMLGLFLLLSPLAPARFSLPATVRSLPLAGIPFRLVQRRNAL